MNATQTQRETLRGRAYRAGIRDAFVLALADELDGLSDIEAAREVERRLNATYNRGERQALVLSYGALVVAGLLRQPEERR